jgi:hypothetical protein
MQKYLLAAFLIFGFFISNAQDRQELIRRAQILAKSAGVDLNRDSRHSNRFNHMELRSPEFRGAIKQRLDRGDFEERDSTGVLVPVGNNSFTYNANNQQTQTSLNLETGIPGFLIPLFVENFFYENNRLTKREVEEIDFNTFLLVKKSKTTIIYNTKGLVSQLITDIYDEALLDYKPYRREVRYYDVDDRLVQDTVYSLNVDNGQFDFSYRHEYIYNGQGLLQTSQQFTFDKISSTWQNSTREFHTYDANNNLLQKTVQDWKENQSVFVNYEQNTAIYNADGGINRITTLFWNPNINNWENEDKYEYINDNNYNKDDLLIPLFSEDFEVEFNRFNKMLKTESSYKFDIPSNDWLLSVKSTFVYSQQIVINTEDTKLEGVSFYPNPVESSLSIRNQKGAGIFELFNVQGQKIIHQEVVGDAQVDLSQQTPGFYFYKMTIGGKSATGKLVKN